MSILFYYNIYVYNKTGCACAENIPAVISELQWLAYI